MSVSTLTIPDNWRGRVRTVFTRRGAAGLAWLALLAISALVLPPLLMIVIGSMTDSQPGDPLHFTLDTLHEAYGEPSLYRSLLNSVIYAASTSVISLMIGGALAWLVERSDGAPRSLVRLFSIVPILLPAVVFTSAWIMLLNPTSGPAARLLAPFLPRSFSVTAYSFAGMIFIGALQDLPLAFLWLWPAFKAVNTQLEEAAYMSGASTFRVTIRITLPLLAPAILAAALISFITGLSALSVPLMVGLPAGIVLYSTEIYLAVNRVPSDLNSAGALCILFLALTIVSLYGYRKVLGDIHRFSFVTGKAYAPKPISLGRWRIATKTTCYVLFLLLCGLPVFVIGWNAVMPYPQVPSLENLHLMTFKNFGAALHYGPAIRAVVNSICLGLAAGIIATLLGFAVAILQYRSSQQRIASLADHIGTAPITFPGILVGVSLLWTFLTLPVPVYGTRWILLIAYSILFLPYAVRSSNAALALIHRELDEAAYMSGASHAQTVLRVIAPLLAPSLSISVIYIMLRSIREYAASIFLTAAGTEVFSVLVLDMWSGGNSNILAAYAIMVMGFITILMGLMFWASERGNQANKGRGP